MQNYDAGRKYAALIVLSVLIAGVSGVWGYSGGEGTTEDPYQISIIEDWQELMENSENWDKNFILINDIDLTNITLVPVGNNITIFRGVFNGNNKVIRNARIDTPETPAINTDKTINAAYLRPAS